MRILVCLLLSSVYGLGHPTEEGDEVVEEIDFEVADPGLGTMEREDPLQWSLSSHAPVDRAFSVPLPRTVRKGYLQYIIEHRNRTTVDDDTFHNFFGFDGGNLKIGLGLYYGVLDNLDVGVYRLNGTVEKFDTWQFSSKWKFLSETNHWLDAALLGGGTLYTIAKEEDDSGGFASLLLGRSLGRHLYASAGGLWHSNSSAEQKTVADDDESTAVMGSLSAHVSPRIMLTGEFSTPVSGYNAHTTAWAGGIKFVTLGHTFSLLAGNTQYISLDGLAAGTSFDSDEVVLGFVITRDVRLFRGK